MGCALSLALALWSQVPLPGTSSVTVPLSPPEACARCHASYDPLGSPSDTWMGSAMGHAGRDPIFLAALTEAEGDHPGVGDFCLRCHVPEAWLEGRCFPTDGSILQATDAGVTCSSCHRMLPNPYLRNAEFILADDSILRGPYSSTTAAHAAAHSDWFEDSGLCGTCHDVLNPLVRRWSATGTAGAPLFPEQTTYSEWAHSAFAAEDQSCQSCHMPDLAGRAAKDGPLRAERGSHSFSGGNNFLLRSIGFLYPDLGIASQLALGQARNIDLLRSAATLSVTATPTLHRGEPARIALRVTNHAGHKLPTGYPIGRKVFVSVSAPALSLSLGSFDSHGEPIQPAAIYEATPGVHGVGPGDHLAINDQLLRDTRIPPRGMINSSTLAPVGASFQEVAPGVLAHWDDLSVTATAPPTLPGLDCASTATIGVRVELRLWYASTGIGALSTLLGEIPVGPRRDNLQAAMVTTPPAAIEMAFVTLVLPVDRDSYCGPPDAGVVDSGVARDAGVHDVGGADGAAIADAGSSDGTSSGCSCGTTTERGEAGLLGGLILAALAGAIRAGRRNR